MTPEENNTTVVMESEHYILYEPTLYSRLDSYLSKMIKSVCRRISKEQKVQVYTRCKTRTSLVSTLQTIMASFQCLNIRQYFSQPLDGESVTL